MSSSVSAFPVASGPGSVTGVPDLPSGFTETFASRYVNTGDLRQHVVVGGDGPPLLLMHGWPQTWYAWRLVMPSLARQYEVIAPDQRGAGLSGKPETGYDAGTLANDLLALMHALGHERFAMFGHDLGMWTGYALAADHPEAIERLAVAETPVPGLAPSPPLFLPARLNDRLWHFAFNRLAALNEEMVAGREDVYFGWQFESKAAHSLPESMHRFYVETLAASRDALHGCFGMYRALDETAAQNVQRKNTRLTLPVLAMGGAASLGDMVAETMKLGADNVETVVIPDCGHWVAEEAPDAVVAALAPFFAPYREQRVDAQAGIGS